MSTTDPQADGFDYDSDGLPFDAPAGYEPGDYWLREQLLNSDSQAEVEAAKAWEPDAIDVGRVLARLRKVLATASADGESDSDPRAFSGHRVRFAAICEGFSSAEAARLEEAMLRAGHIEIAGTKLVEGECGQVVSVPTYALTEAST